MKTMEALDNPSYFSVPGASHESKFSLLRKRGMGGANSSSTASLTSHPGSGSAGPAAPSSTFTFPSANRRSFRTLLRSMSSDSDSAQLLVLGNPRPCDLAPGHRPRRRASSSASELIAQEAAAAVQDDDGEVFLAPGGDVRYYNLSVPRSTAGRRRHSIGTFLRSAAEPAHSLRKRCDKCMEKGGVKSNSDLLDIVILSSGHSETASLWVTYLSTCFQQISKEQSRPPFKLVCVQLEDVLVGAALSQNDRLAKARLQIVILCPGFLEQIETSPGPASALSTLLQPSRVLAMLLGVNDDSITIQHRAALLCFDEWRRVLVKDQDPTFVGDFLGVAMDILSRSWQIQQAINQLRNDEKKAHFSLIPKKVKMGQDKLIILLNEPLHQDDKITISIDKNGTRLEPSSVKRRNPYTIQFTMPAACLQVSMLASVFVEKNGKPLGHRLVKCECRMRELDQLLRSTDNPLQFMCQSLGLNPGERDQVDVFLVASLQRNLPPDFNLLQPAGHRYHAGSEEYPTLLHFAARFGLEKLSWQLLECPGGEQACQIRNACQLTPADMAERAGHVRLANALKGYLQMTELSSMYSYLKGITEKQTPSFSEANYLLPRPLNDTYLIPPAARPVLTPFSTASSPTSHHPSMPFYTNLESYKVPPSPILLSGSMDYNIPPIPLPLESIFERNKSAQSISSTPPTTPSSPKDNFPPGLYMEMHSNGSEKSSSTSTLRQRNNSYCCHQNKEHSESTTTPTSNVNCQGVHNHCARGQCRKNSTSSSTGSAKHSQHGAQDELVEIINDFKNNVFTIAEVEKLVASWQNRHDVQQSFKEKQEQLNAMREEYERIQQKMKSNMKRATPFERIRKFFSRGKSKHSSCSEECRQRQTTKETGENVTGSASAASICHRPASSLSLHSSCSSGSSGRMSTASGTSLGDSGTHSDPDEKKSNPCEVVQHDSKSKVPTRLDCCEPPSITTTSTVIHEVTRLSRTAINDLPEYVAPDRNSCTTGTLTRLTSLTHEDTIHEDQENSIGDCCQDTEENNEDVSSSRNSLKVDSIEKEKTEEIEGEIAIVEVHPPPLQEIPVSLPPLCIVEETSKLIVESSDSTKSDSIKNDSVENCSSPTEDIENDILEKTCENILYERLDGSETISFNTLQIMTITTTAAAKTTTTNTTTSTASSTTTITTAIEEVAKKSDCVRSHINFCELRKKFAVLEKNVVSHEEVGSYVIRNGNENETSANKIKGKLPRTDDKIEGTTVGRVAAIEVVDNREENNSDDETMNETDDLLENLQLHDYMNVSIPSPLPPPPVPPRGSYNHLTL